MGEKFQKIKGVVINKSDVKDNKKKIENLVVFIIILIVTIIAINAIWNTDNKESNTNLDTNKQLAKTDEHIDEEITSEDKLRTNLKNILEKINGVGQVDVLITYSESSQIVAMYNENTKETSTEEKDETGGTRVIKESDTQKDVIYEEDNGEKKPITQKTVMPKIEGAIITAQGASNADVKTNIIQAVEAVTGLATHKIQVFEMIVK